MNRYEPPTQTILVGPGLDPREHAPARPVTHAEKGSEVLPEDGLARSENSASEEADETGRAARRVIIALLLGIVAVPALLWGMVAVNAEVTPATAITLIGLVAIGAVGGAAATDRASGRVKRAARRDDEGRPVGCCPGPRPLRAFRDK